MNIKAWHATETCLVSVCALFRATAGLGLLKLCHRAAEKPSVSKPHVQGLS